MSETAESYLQRCLSTLHYHYIDASDTTPQEHQRLAGLALDRHQRFMRYARRHESKPAKRVRFARCVQVAAMALKDAEAHMAEALGPSLTDEQKVAINEELRRLLDNG